LKGAAGYLHIGGTGFLGQLDKCADRPALAFFPIHFQDKDTEEHEQHGGCGSDADFRVLPEFEWLFSRLGRVGRR